MKFLANGNFLQDSHSIASSSGSCDYDSAEDAVVVVITDERFPLPITRLR